MPDPSCFSPFTRQRSKGGEIVRPNGGCVTIPSILDFLPELNAHGFRCYWRPAITDAQHRILRDELRKDTAALKSACRWLKGFEACERWTSATLGIPRTWGRGQRARCDDSFLAAFECGGQNCELPIGAFVHTTKHLQPEDALDRLLRAFPQASLQCRLSHEYVPARFLARVFSRESLDQKSHHHFDVFWRLPAPSNTLIMRE